MPSLSSHFGTRLSLQSDASEHVSLEEFGVLQSAGHSRSRGVSEDIDEIDWATRPLVRSSSPPNLGWSRTRTNGLVGRFLYSSATGWVLYIGLLVMAVSAAELGTTLLNRRVLFTSDWRFPYPVTLTFYQFLATHLVLLLLATISRLCRPLLDFIGLEGLVAPSPTLPIRPFQPHRRLPFWANRFIHFLRPLGTARHGISGGGLGELNFATLKSMAPVTLVFVAKVTLSNVSLATSALPKYTLARVHSFPITLVLTMVLDKVSFSHSTLSSALTAALNLLIASVQAGGPGPFDATIAGVISGIFSGIYPVMLVRTYSKLLRQAVFEQDSSAIRSPGRQSPTTRGSYEAYSNYQSRFNEAPTTLVHWRLLHYLSLMSIVAVFPILLLTGEIKDLQENCYVLDTRHFWNPATGAFFCGLVVFVLLPVFAAASGAVATGFLAVPRQALQLAITGPNMPVHSWVGVIMCWASSFWFAVVQWKESRVLDRLET